MADPRAEAAEIAADFLVGGSPQLRTRCSCPAAASAVAAVADAAAAGSAGAAVGCDAVIDAMVGDGCVFVVAVAVSVPDVVAFDPH